MKNQYSPKYSLSVLLCVLVTVGKNKPLSSDKPKWKSETPLTMGQLRSKRDEYWETQPAFGGRREIWDALRAACETEDNGLAQAIVNGANITLPTGSSFVMQIGFLTILPFVAPKIS